MLASLVVEHDVDLPRVAVRVGRPNLVLHGEAAGDFLFDPGFRSRLRQPVAGLKDSTGDAERLLIEADDPNVVEFEQVTGGQMNANTLARQDYYQTQYRLLRSRAVAKKTIDTLKLWDDHELAPPADGESSITGAVRGVAGWASGLFGGGEEIEAPQADETMAQADAIDAFLERLSVSPVRDQEWRTILELGG